MEKTTNEGKQIKIITDYFKSVLKKDEEENVEDIAPTEMESPLTKEETQKAVKTLKNGKVLEQMRYSQNC